MLETDKKDDDKSLNTTDTTNSSGLPESMQEGAEKLVEVDLEANADAAEAAAKRRKEKEKQRTEEKAAEKAAADKAKRLSQAGPSSPTKITAAYEAATVVQTGPAIKEINVNAEQGVAAKKEAIKQAQENFFETPVLAALKPVTVNAALSVGSKASVFAGPNQAETVTPEKRTDAPGKKIKSNFVTVEQPEVVAAPKDFQKIEGKFADKEKDRIAEETAKKEAEKAKKQEEEIKKAVQNNQAYVAKHLEPKSPVTRNLNEIEAGRKKDITETGKIVQDKEYAHAGGKLKLTNPEEREKARLAAEEAEKAKLNATAEPTGKDEPQVQVPAAEGTDIQQVPVPAAEGTTNPAPAPTTVAEGTTNPAPAPTTAAEGTTNPAPAPTTGTDGTGTVKADSKGNPAPAPVPPTTQPVVPAPAAPVPPAANADKMVNIQAVIDAIKAKRIDRRGGASNKLAKFLKMIGKPTRLLKKQVTEVFIKKLESLKGKDGKTTEISQIEMNKLLNAFSEFQKNVEVTRTTAAKDYAVDYFSDKAGLKVLPNYGSGKHAKGIAKEDIREAAVRRIYDADYKKGEKALDEGVERYNQKMAPKAKKN